MSSMFEQIEGVRHTHRQKAFIARSITRDMAATLCRRYTRATLQELSSCRNNLV